MINIFTHILIDRQHQVKIGNIYSRTGSPNGGVPQVTPSGPNYFVVDLETHVPLYNYVEGSTLFEICNMNEMSEIQESIDKAADWTSLNFMKINSKKSNEMIISFTHDVNFKKSVPNTIIEGNPVEVVTHAKHCIMVDTISLTTCAVDSQPIKVQESL